MEELAAEAGADVLGWADVPFNVEALPAGSSARRTAPVVRQALFRRPAGIGEDGWFACRYLLRLALDETLSETVGDGFAISSLSNRTVVYRGLAELSRVADLYPDLRDEHFASRFVLFHSRYSTNTTTAWRRAQPFWSLAHNGEIATIRGNVAWMHAIGRDLLRRMVDRHPGLKRIASRVRSVVCAGGSDSANLDDMLIALLAGGLSLPQSLLALLPEAPSRLEREPTLSAFHEAMGVLLGACDGPAAIVACDGDEAVAHLDRNGLRPLWITTTRDYALAASELTGTADLGKVEMQRIFGPGDTAVVRLNSGEVLLTEDVHRVVAQQRFPAPKGRTEGRSCGGRVEVAGELGRLQVAFGMTKEDLDVVLAPLVKDGKLAVGLDGRRHPARGDARRPAAPARRPLQAALRPGDLASHRSHPRRLGVRDHGGAGRQVRPLGRGAQGPHYVFPQRILSAGELCWLRGQERVAFLDATFPAADGPEGLERALTAAVESGLARGQEAAVLVLSDRAVDATRAPLPGLRLVARLHDAIVKAGFRHKVGLVADFGVWDVHHCALLVSLGADAVCPWLGSLTAGEHEESYLKGLRTGFVEAMSMIGVTPASAYCGAKLVEAVGLDPAFLEAEFPGVPGHLGGLSPEILDREWLEFHATGLPSGHERPGGRRRVPLPPGGPAALQRPRRGARAARGLGLQEEGATARARLGARPTPSSAASCPAATPSRCSTCSAFARPRPLSSRRSSPKRTCSGASWSPA